MKLEWIITTVTARINWDELSGMVFNLSTSLAAWGSEALDSIPGRPYSHPLRLSLGETHSHARASLWRSEDTLGERLLLLPCQFRLSGLMANVYLPVCLYGAYFVFRTLLDSTFSMSNSGLGVKIAICKDWKLVDAVNHLQFKRLLFTLCWDESINLGWI